MQQLVSIAKAHPNLAFLYAFIGNVSLAFMQILFKQAARYMSPFQALFYRSVVLLMVTHLLLARENKSPYISAEPKFRAVLIRISFMAGSTAAMLYSVKYLPVSTCSTIWNMAPIFIFFIEAFHNKNALNLKNFLLTLLSFAGVVLMIQPELIFGESSAKKMENYYFYIGLTLGSAMGYALNMHFIHGLAKTIEPLVNIYYSHIGFVSLASFLCNFKSQRINLENVTPSLLVVILGVIVTGWLAQTFIILANSLKKPSLMMPFGYLGVVTGFLADIYLFDTQFTFITIVGIFLTSGGLLSGFLLQKAEPAADNPAKPELQVQAEQKPDQSGDIAMHVSEGDKQDKQTTKKDIQ